MNISTQNHFDIAGKAVLKYLYMKFGFALWMITRVEGNDWIVLQSEDHGYQVQPGKVFPWADSFCARMVADKGPNIVSEIQDTSPYADAPIRESIHIEAYMGVPIRREDGLLFGTLCGIDPHQQPSALRDELPLLDLLSELLSQIVQLELKGETSARRAEQLEVEALTDSLTGLYNRRGWNKLLADEERRCAQLGHPAAVFVVDLDGLKYINDTAGHIAGDKLIIHAAQVLRLVVRPLDVVARLGGDEFGILCVGCDDASGEKMRQRLCNELSKAQIKASIGMSLRDPAQGIEIAWQHADNEMYINKKNHK